MKRIIVLSDGTGNSAASPFKTNVWRTYEALDLASGDQIARYDDGVGTSSVKFLAIIGGAFGWGLKRIVLDLYKFLCRNYDPGNPQKGIPADEIYAFGFSRGAFTIRVLIGLVVNQGLVRWHSEEELDMLANAAYRAYRAERYRRGILSLSTLGRRLRDVGFWVQKKLLGLKPYTTAPNRKVDAIRFLGLWDTVDAYGMPIKELKAGIDRYIWPLLFDSNQPSDRIQRGCHALAIDDERATFHPLVWDVSGMKNPERFEQVWFPGMHANVGGGYPEDDLPHVPLVWILDEAAKTGLRLKQNVVTEYRLKATALGRVHDSRAGINSYYRYSPRIAATLCAPAIPRIDPCVYYRIAYSGDKYSPIAIPEPPGKGLESEMVWDTVWWRRTAYWSMLMFTLLLVSLAFSPPIEVPLTDPLAGKIVERLVKWANSATSDAMEDQLRQIGESPTIVLVLIAVAIACYLWGQLLAGRIRDRAAELWSTQPNRNQVIWFKQSKQRWSGISSLALIAAAAAFGWYVYRRRDLEPPAIALAVAAAFFAWRRWYDAKRLRQVASGNLSAMKGWSLRFAERIRTLPAAIAFAKVMSHKVIPFFFAYGLIAGVAYAIYRLWQLTAGS